MDFTLTNGGIFIVNTKSQNRTGEFGVETSGDVPIHLSWVIQVNAGSLQLSTSLYYDDFGFDEFATVKSHNLTAIYLPVQY